MLKAEVKKLGYSGLLLDTPNVSYSNQTGINDNEILNDRYDVGLRWILLHSYILLLITYTLQILHGYD